MKKIHRQFQEATAHIALEVHEKALMRERLVTYMSYRPLRAHRHSPFTHLLQAFDAIPLTILSYFRVRHVSGALIIAIFVTTSMVGVSSAATHALPGDILYPVKVNINEEVQGVLITSSEARVAWEQERAERRLEEAGQLAAAGKLDAETQAQVSHLFSTQATKVFAQVQEIEHTDPMLAMEISNEIEQAFDTHEETLARILVEHDTEENPAIARELVTHVRQVANKASEMRANAEIAFVGNTVSPLLEQEAPSEHGEISEEKGDDASYARERAAYRAQERAMQLGTAATTAVASLDGASELAIQAHKGMDQASTLMVEGEEALALKQHVTAYRRYREASNIFGKMIRLVKTNRSYEVKVSSLVEPVAFETPKVDTVLPDPIAGTQENATNVTSAESEYVTTDSLYTQATDVLARARLLEVHRISSTTAENAEDILKDAAAHLLRGEAAISSGSNDEETRALFSRTYELAHQAIEIITATSTPSAPLFNDVAEEIPPSGSSTEAETPASVRVLIEPTPENGGLIRGAVIIPGWCGEVAASTTPAEGGASNLGVTLVLTTSSVPRVCAAEGTSVFETMVPEQKTSILRAVLNGMPVSWEVSTSTLQLSPSPTVGAE